MRLKSKTQSILGRPRAAFPVTRCKSWAATVWLTWRLERSAYASRSWNSRLRVPRARTKHYWTTFRLRARTSLRRSRRAGNRIPGRERGGALRCGRHLAIPGTVIQSFSSAVAAECFSDAGLRDRRTRRRGDNKKAGFLRPSKFFVAIEFQSTHPVANSHDHDRAHASDSVRPLSNASHPT